MPESDCGVKRAFRLLPVGESLRQIHRVFTTEPCVSPAYEVSLLVAIARKLRLKRAVDAARITVVRWCWLTIKRQLNAAL